MQTTPAAKANPPEHLVQFYDSDDALFDRVGEFVSAGLACGEPVVVIATEPHRQGFERRLATLGFDVTAAIAEERLVMLDAHETLARFMVDGVPDRERFESAVGGLIERMLDGGAHPRMRAYGEMVDVLWRAGSTTAALRLEELWNELAARCHFDLLCAYTMASFYTSPNSYREVCERHTHVAPAEGTGELRALGAEIARRKEVEAELRETIAALRRSQENERSRAERLVRLQEATARLAAALSVAEVSTVVLDACASLLGASASVLYLGGEDGRYRLAATRNAPNVEHKWPDLGLDTPVPLAHAISVGEPLWIESHADLIARFPNLVAAVVPASELRAIAALPLIHGRRVIGGIALSFDAPRTFSQDERDWFAGFTTQCALAAERARLYHAERRAIEELSETIRLNDLFSGILAHDLRNPLSAVIAGAELILARSADDSQSRPAQRILTSAHRMARMIDQMLDFTRIRVGGGLPLEARPSDLAPVLGHVVDELRAAHRQQTIRFAVDGGQTTGTWDDDRLGQAFSNLIGNAAQHGRADAGVDIALDASDPGRVRVSIHNAGAIPPELLPRMFEPMTGGQRRRDGSRGLGLGLFITREIVRIHGGTIEVHSSESEGTSFVVTLPRDAAAPVVDPAPLEPQPIESARRVDRMRALVDSVRDYAIFMLDPEGRVVTWNRGAEVAKGYTTSEIVGKSFEAFYTPDDRERGHPKALLAEAIEKGRVEDEGWRVRKDGTLFWADVVITALRDDAGQLTGFAKVTRDLSERRLAEEQLRRSEERFRLMIESVKDYSILMLDPDGRIVTWNAGAERIHGYRAEEIVGEHLSRFLPADAERAQRHLEVARRDGKIEDEGWRLRKDGTAFWSNVVLTAVHNSRGELAGFVKVTRDLTERKRLEHEMIRFAHAQEGIRLRDEFLSIVSHELKTPLTGLQLQLDSLDAIARDRDPKVDERLARASASSQRLHQLIDTLLDVSRIATGRFTLSIERVDLATAVREVVDSFQPAAARAGSPLTMQLDSIVGSFDRERIQQLATNLIGNALKYAAGTPIEVAVIREDGHAVIEVRDRGPGVPPGDLDRIFDRFERAASARHYGGLGLGLYVAREIAEAHGGTVAATNLEPGAAFKVRLPIVS